MSKFRRLRQNEQYVACVDDGVLFDYLNKVKKLTVQTPQKAVTYVCKMYANLTLQRLMRFCNSRE